MDAGLPTDLELPVSEAVALKELAIAEGTSWTNTAPPSLTEALLAIPDELEKVPPAGSDAEVAANARKRAFETHVLTDVDLVSVSTFAAARCTRDVDIVLRSIFRLSRQGLWLTYDACNNQPTQPTRP